MRGRAGNQFGAPDGCGGREIPGHRPRHLERDGVLQAQQVGRVAVVASLPPADAVGGLDQPRRYPHPLSGTAHAALHQVAEAERAGPSEQLTGIAALEPLDRAAAGHPEPRKVAQPRGDLLADAPREVCVRGVVRQVAEGQNRHPPRGQAARFAGSRHVARAAGREPDRHRHDRGHGEERRRPRSRPARRGRGWGRAGGRGTSERVGELAGAGVAVGGDLAERAEHHPLERLRHRAPNGSHAGHRIHRVPGHDRLRRGPGERRLAGQHLVQHAAEGCRCRSGRPPRSPPPAPGSCTPASRVRSRSPSARRRVCAAVGQRPRDPEVGDQRVPVAEQDVLGLDVAVHDAAAVGVGQRVGDLAGDADGVLDGSCFSRASRSRSDSPSTYGIT